MDPSDYHLGIHYADWAYIRCCIGYSREQIVQHFDITADDLLNLESGCGTLPLRTLYELLEYYRLYPHFPKKLLFPLQPAYVC